MAFAELRTVSGLDKIALRGTRIRSRLTAFHQDTTVEQTYVNREDQAVEVVYTFPLPASAAVCGFEVTTSDGCLRGEVEQADEALNRYKSAIRAGDGAFLLEQKRPDVFSAWAGNLKPGQAVTLKLRYVAALTAHERELRVCYPTTIAPRYASSAGTDPIDAAIDADILNPPHLLHVPYGVSLEVRVDLNRPLRGVTSPSHLIASHRENDGATLVRFAHAAADMNRDIVLQIELDRELEPRASSAVGADGEKFVAVTFIPEFESENDQPPQPRETIFVLDCSGSMEGSSIEQARQALSLCLRALSNGDSFNICRFGSTFEWMSAEPLIYNAQTLARAAGYTQTIRADLGGTEMHAPLASLFKMPARVGQVRDVVLLTDGQVTNEPAIIHLASQHRSGNRLFVFGIGTAASHHLTQELASVTGGASEAIFPGERIEEKVLRTFSRMGSGTITNVMVNWDVAGIQTATAAIPPVFDGDPITVLARCSGRFPEAAEFRCDAKGRSHHWRVAIPPPVASQEPSSLPQLWARDRIDDLRSRIGTESQTRDRLHGRSTQKDIISLSIQYGVLCEETTYVAVEQRAADQKTIGEPVLRRVPLMLNAGWHGIDALAGAPAAPMTRSRVMAKRSADLSEELSADKGESLDLGNICYSVRDTFDDHLRRETFDANRESSGVMKILMRQAADGSFALDAASLTEVDALLPQLATWRQNLPAFLAAKLGSQSTQAVTAATVETILAIVLFRTVFATESSLWKRAERKAMWFLRTKIASPHPLVDEAVADLNALKSP